MHPEKLGLIPYYPTVSYVVDTLDKVKIAHFRTGTLRPFKNVLNTMWFMHIWGNTDTGKLKSNFGYKPSSVGNLAVDLQAPQDILKHL